KSMKRATALEIADLRARGHDYAPVKAIRKWWHRDEAVVPARHRAAIEQVLQSSPTLHTTWSMRQELARIWERSTLTTEQLVQQLKDWCERAEKSGIAPLVEFSQRLRSYA